MLYVIIYQSYLAFKCAVLNFALACAVKTFHTIRRPLIASIQQAKAQKLHRPANDEVTKNTIF